MSLPPTRRVPSDANLADPASDVGVSGQSREVERHV